MSRILSLLVYAVLLPMLLVGCADSELAILEAAEKQDLARMQKLVKRGNSVNVKNVVGQTALIVAAEKGYLQIATFLIDNGADLNARDSTLEEGAIHFALRRNDKRMLQLLLSKGADVNLPGDALKPPLTYAVERENIEQTKLLLRFKANPNAQDKVGIRPLWKSLMLNNSELVSLLLENGAEIKVGSNGDIFDAVYQCDLEIVDLLIQHGANINEKSPTYGSPLFMALKRKDKQIVEFLIKMGADLTMRDKDGHTPMERIIEDQDTEMYKILKKVTDK